MAINVGPLVTPLDPLGVAVGVQFEPFSVYGQFGATAPATQTIYGVLMAVTGGATLTGVQFRNSTAAAGTLPTTARFGVADITQKVLAVSANVNALASWAAGANAIPFTAPVVVPQSATALYACFVVNGVWGTTQPTPSREGIAATNIFAAYSTFPAPLIAQTGQTDLPAVGSTMGATNNANVFAYYLALY